MSNNIQRLGNVLSNRMIKTANAAVGVYTELGVMSDSLALIPDSLQVPIQQGDYLVQKGQKLQAGDRVVVLWCGNEPAVVGPADDEEQPLPIEVTDDGQGNVIINF